MGYRTIWGSISRNNLAMLALARRVGFALSADPDDLSAMLAELSL